MSAPYPMDIVFSRAGAYRRLAPDRFARAAPALFSGAPAMPAAVRERGPAMEFVYSERHLKCVWFDDALRPALLRTEEGADIAVACPGRWNLEAGPDFLGATLRAGPGRRQLRGDVEVHAHPADWQRHGHGRDPAYARVIAHVTWFPGRPPQGAFPPAAVHISLRDAVSANPLFSFESLDVAAYPYARRAAGAPCARLLAAWTPDKLAALLEAAGEERLRRKAARLADAMDAKGPDQVLYEELMTALGYKHNRTPFRTLAERCALAELREASGRDVTTAYALLLGIAGLLPAQTESRWDAETRALVRQLWNRWWKRRARWAGRGLNPGAWKLGGIRPHNHPRRRLMAAAFLFTQPKAPADFLLSLPRLSPADWTERVMAWLQPKAGTYWRNRLALGGQRRPAAALIGERCAAAMLANVAAPFLAAGAGRGPAAGRGEHSPSFPNSELLRQLPPEDDNSLIRQMAASLLGSDHNPRLYRTGLRQQGLIQMFQDFCLDDRSGCAACPLLKNLEAFARQA